MAYEVVTAQEIYLNGYKYRARSPILGSFIDPFPGQLSIGGDDYNNQVGVSSLVIDNLSGGIGTEKFISPNMCYFTDCIIENPGHILPPRLATAISTFTAGTTGIWTKPTAATGADWTNPSYAIDGNTGTAANTTAEVADNTWSGYITMTFASYNIDKVRLWFAIYTGNSIDIDLYYDAAWHDEVDETNETTGQYNTYTLAATREGVTQARVRMKQTSGGTRTAYVYELGLSVLPDTDGTIAQLVNFNGNQYMAKGKNLLKLDSDRGGYTSLKTFPADITALISSLNSRLYIYLGDSNNYWYMSTAEAFTQSNSANAYWGIQHDAKLFKMNTSGTVAYSTDPDGATPTWTSGSKISDIASQIEGFEVGRDASGNSVIYVPTNSILKVYDSATPQWLDTEAVLPNHPIGGQGHAYFNGKIYLSYGLAVKEYYPENGSFIDVGLTERDGLPIEYNGEIVKLQGEAGTKLMFALVDSSITSGNSKSGLYAFNGSAWYCWWKDTSNNGAMHDCIVSSAASGYAVYWDVGGVVYYIDIPRGIQNPDKISQSYATAGLLLSPWFDAGDQGAAKLAKVLTDFAKGITTTETVALKYRIDKTNTDIATGWTTLDTLNTTGETGYNEELFSSGAGIAFKTIQLGLDFVTAGSTAKADIQSLKLLFKKRTGGLKIRRWIVDVLLDDYANGPTGNEKAKAKITNLNTALTSATDVVFCYRPNEGSDESHYVSVECEKFEELPGPEYSGGYYKLVLTKV